MPKKGLTLLEVLVSFILLGICVAGIMRVIVSGKRWMMDFQLRSRGGELGKLFLDPLQSSVRQDQWDSAASDYLTGNDLKTNLPPSTLQPSIAIPVPDVVISTVYTPDYKITSPIPGSQLRKVVVRVNWSEEANPH